MKIAVLGGSFNPVHTGHLALADEVCTSLGYDRVLFVPAYKPPHKDMNSRVSSQDRLEMVKLAVAGDSRFEAESCEIDRQGVSYTFDTVCFLEEKYKDCLEGKIGLVMGDDLLPGFHLWHKAQELSEKCTLILAVRPEDEHSAESSNKAIGSYASVEAKGYDFKKDPLFADAVRLHNQPWPLSSSQIREKAANGSAFRYLVPDGVFNYIRNRHLYEL